MSAAPVIQAHTKAVIFDAYGTIFDVHSAVLYYAARIGPDATHLSDIWRTKQLEYSWVLSLAERYEHFSSLTEKALDYALARCPGVDKAIKPLLLAAYANLDAFPDVRGALDTLRARSLKTGILSNGDPEMLAASVSSAGLNRSSTRSCPSTARACSSPASGPIASFCRPCCWRRTRSFSCPPTAGMWRARPPAASRASG